MYKIKHKLKVLIILISHSRMSTDSLLHKAAGRKFPVFDCEEEKEWKGPFIFIQGSDTQFGMINSYILKKPEPNWDKEIALTKQAINSINLISPRPKFFVVCGDLVDQIPNDEVRAGQVKAYIKAFKELIPEIPLVCVCGNHDVGNTPTNASIANYRKDFGDDYFSFFAGGVMFIVINSQFYEDRSMVQDLAEEQDKWLDDRLEEAKNCNYKHIVIFQHIPWFVSEPDEDKMYFNIEINLRKKMLAKFYEANVRTIMCGHYHRNAGGFYKDMELVVTSAVGAQLGNDKSGFRIVKVLNDSIKHKYYALDDVPKEITL